MDALGLVVQARPGGWLVGRLMGRLVRREEDSLEARPNVGVFGSGEMVGGKLLGGMTVGV